MLRREQWAVQLYSQQLTRYFELCPQAKSKVSCVLTSTRRACECELWEEGHAEIIQSSCLGYGCCYCCCCCSWSSCCSCCCIGGTLVCKCKEQQIRCRGKVLCLMENMSTSRAGSPLRNCRGSQSPHHWVTPFLGQGPTNWNCELDS